MKEGMAKIILKAENPGFVKVKAEVGKSFVEAIVQVEEFEAPRKILGFEFILCLFLMTFFTLFARNFK